MTGERGLAAELVLEELRRGQDRLAVYMTAGFITGFIVGMLFAWFIVHAH